MKKYLFLIIITFVFILTGCSNDFDEYCYEINYVEEYQNSSFIINSVEELQSFYRDYKEIFGLDSIEKYDVNGFYDIYDKYDSVNYFGKGNRLVLLILNEGYDATKHRLMSISYNDETLIVNIECSIPGMGGNVPAVCGSCLMVLEIPEYDPTFDSVEINKVTKE